jgi:hypothetical protein
MAATYDIGDAVRISATFTQQSVAVDPSTVTLKVTLPDRSQITYTYAGSTVMKDSVGNYHVDLVITLRGTHLYRWFSTGGGAAAEENWFQVRTQRVA